MSGAHGELPSGSAGAGAGRPEGLGWRGSPSHPPVPEPRTRWFSRRRGRQPLPRPPLHVFAAAPSFGWLTRTRRVKSDRSRAKRLARLAYVGSEETRARSRTPRREPAVQPVPSTPLPTATQVEQARLRAQLEAATSVVDPALLLPRFRAPPAQQILGGYLDRTVQHPRGIFRTVFRDPARQPARAGLTAPPAQDGVQL